MSDSSKVEKNWMGSGHDLYLDEFYLISYSDQLAKMNPDEFNRKYTNYLAISKWPDSTYKFKALAELPPDENPNFIKITGRMLLEWVEKGFIPQFDKYFEKTRRLVMIPVESLDFFIEHSKMLRK